MAEKRDMCLGQCQLAECPMSSVLSAVIEHDAADQNSRPGMIIINKAFDKAWWGIKYHSDMAGSLPRIYGWLQRGVGQHDLPPGFTREDFLHRVAACVVQDCPIDTTQVDNRGGNL